MDQQTRRAIEELKSEVTVLRSMLNDHAHDGSNSKRILQDNIVPNIGTCGNITMSTSGTVYKIAVASNPSNVLFYGNVVHRTTGVIDIRAVVTGSALLGKNFYMQTGTSSSTLVGGPPQYIVQSCAYMLLDSTSGGGTAASTVKVRALSTEGSGSSTQGGIVFVRDTTNAIVAVGNITAYYVDHIEITATLSTGWEIDGNFVIT